MSTPADPPRDDPPQPKDVFVAALALPPEQRDAYVENACRAHQELLARVQALLNAYQKAGGFLEAGGGSDAAAPDSTQQAGASLLHSVPDPLIGERIGSYKLLERVGEGGFGAVYMAEQREPVHRKVALKLIKPGMDSRQVIARFEAERQALALMEHPHIARVFDGGVTEATIGARPYFVMEYVKGDAIVTFADAHRLSIRDRLDLFTQVCQAVQHAHTKGIIHRDLKPRNVLVSMVDGRPFAKVIDFGIAKATGSPLTDKTLFTEHRQLVGTPEYMSPEQAEGSPDIDTRTDVYALGVLLYELLAGATPFDAKRLRSAAFAEMQRIIKEEEPPLPSVRSSRSLETLVATAAARQVEPGGLGTMIRGDLDWITMKCLEKDRGRRYGTASDLAADVQRHLAGEAVFAAPPSRTYRLRKFVRKHRGPVIAAGLVTATLVLGVIGTWVGLIVARAAEKRATTEAERASHIARFMQSTLFGAGSTEELAANRNVLRELIASAASSSEVLDPRRWPNVRLALRLIEGHWRETPPSTAEFSRVLNEMLDAALATNGGGTSESTSGALAEHNARGVLLVLTARLAEAQEIFRAALALTDNAGDRTARLSRAYQLSCLGLVNEAAGTPGFRGLFEEALAIRRRDLGPRHLDTAESLEDLGRACWGWGSEAYDSGSVSRAVALYEECLAIRRADPAAPRVRIARVLSAVGQIELDSNESVEAATVYLREAAAEWQRALPGDHPNVADALVDLGRVLLEVNPDESQQFLHQALQMSLRLEPKPNERTARALLYLAVAQDRGGQLALAADTAERAVKESERLGSRGGWYYALFQMCDSCRRLAATGQVDLAESCYRRLLLLAAAGATWGDDESDRRVRTEFRHFLEWRGRPDEAAGVISDQRMRHLEMVTTEFGVRRRGEGLPYAQRLADELEHIGDSLMVMGQPSEAEEWFRRCLAQREQMRLVARDGSDGSFLLPLTLGKVGWALTKQGKFAEAEPLLLQPSESVFPGRPTEDRRNAIGRLISLYETWQAAEPDETREEKLAKWRERLATLELASGLGEYLGIENVRALLIGASARDTLNYPEWKRARTFVRLMTGEWTDDPLTAVAFRELVARTVRNTDGEYRTDESGRTSVTHPDKSSAEYVSSHAALCVLDGRWDDADTELARAIEARSADDVSDDIVRLLSCLAAVKESLGKTEYSHSLYTRIRSALKSRPERDPVRMAGAIFDAAKQSWDRSGNEKELRAALDLLTSRLPDDDARLIQCELELASAVGSWHVLPPDRQERADSLFRNAVQRAERAQETRPLMFADALRRYGAWLTVRWHSFPPARAAATLEQAAALYRSAGLTDSPQLADTLGNLGTAFWNDGKFMEAAQAMNESAELRLSLGEYGLGETAGHDAGVIPNIIACAHYLAASGDLANAEEYYRKAVSLAERDPQGEPADARGYLREFLVWSGREAQRDVMPDQVPRYSREWMPNYEAELANCCRGIASHLLESRDPGDAERAIQIIERGLSILEAGVAEAERAAWWKHDFDSLLGDALAVRGKLDEAESLSLTSYEGLTSDPDVPETSGGNDRKREAIERIVRLYDAWHLAEPGRGHDAKAAEWRARLEPTTPTSAPSSGP